MVQKAASSSLVSRFSYHFPHRMDIRCFLTGFFGQEDSPDAAETRISHKNPHIFTKTTAILDVSGILGLYLWD